jgi:hypothetical protein
MELQQQDENAEAASLVSSFSLDIAAQHQDDVIAIALYDQELVQRRQGANQVLGERQWKEFYENTGAGRYVT